MDPFGLSARSSGAAGATPRIRGFPLWESIPSSNAIHDGLWGWGCRNRRHDACLNSFLTTSVAPMLVLSSVFGEILGDFEERALLGWFVAGFVVFVLGCEGFCKDLKDVCCFGWTGLSGVVWILGVLLVVVLGIRAGESVWPLSSPGPLPPGGRGGFVGGGWGFQLVVGCVWDGGVVFVWGVFIFCEGRFASFAVVGPFSNGPYGAAVLVFSKGPAGWRSLCGVRWWLGESPSGPAPPRALTPALSRRAGEGVLLLVDGGFGLVIGVWDGGVVFVWESFFLRRCASLPSLCLGRSRTAPTGWRAWCSRTGVAGWWSRCSRRGSAGWHELAAVRFRSFLGSRVPLFGSFAQPIWTGIVGVCRRSIPLCPSDISPVNGRNPGVLQWSLFA